MNVIQAQSLFGFDNLERISKRELKRAYKREMFKTHPDLGGDKQKTQNLNKAYEALLKVVKNDTQPPLSKECEDNSSSFGDELFKRNAGHPLHNSGLAALKSRETLIREAFDIRDDSSTPDIRYWDVRSHTNHRNGVHFRKGELCMQLNFLYGQSHELTLCDTTNGFMHRKSCGVMKIQVERYNEAEYRDTNKCLSNVLLDWFGEKGDRSNGFHWCDFYQDMLAGASKAFRNMDNQFLMSDKAVKVRGDNHYIFVAEIEIDGSVVSITYDEVKSHTVFNPFNLDALKPLKAIPKRWKLMDLVKVLVNGQFHSLKQNYYYTDDYLHDAAMGFRKGYIDNPILTALEWFSERRVSCTRLYQTSNSLNFGFHSNDSSSLVLDLDNRYTLVDVESDVQVLESKLRLAS